MNKRRIFERLAGLETEYAVSVRPKFAHVPLPTRLEVYERVLLSLSRKLPTVRAHHLKEGAFLATGGAVWFEADRLSDNAGLIEGATPECRRPQELLTFQRAQDRLLEEAAAAASTDCDIRLLKNDRDAHGNVYGAQENYEVDFASGWRLACWRIGLVLLAPLMFCTWLMILGILVAAYTYEFLAAGILVPLGEFCGPRGWTASLLLGEDRAQERPFGAPCPAWFEKLLLWAHRLATAPLGAALFLLVWFTGYCSVRAKLIPFLVSRPVLSGAGMLDGDGRFLISDKGPAINSVLGFGGFLNDRPIIVLGHLFKVMAAEAMFSPGDYLDLFQPRQRLQIGLGDSNMCEGAELLRIGTTMLVLDCLEAGAMPDPPRLKRPIEALRIICGDGDITRTIETAQGPCTSLQLQRFYCEACRRFLARRDDAPAEAWQVLRLWEKTLEALEDEPLALVGTLDWVTKRFLLENAPSHCDWESLKKIDLKFHELSPDGYFRMLSEHTPVTRVTNEEEIGRAQRLPPADSPASLRGRLLREYYEGDEPLAVNWRMVRIGRGPAARIFRLADFHSEFLDPNRSPDDAEESDPHPWMDEDEREEE